MFTIYKLIVNEVAQTPNVTYSLYTAPRYEKACEYYATKELADKRAEEIYDGVKKLLGFYPSVEVRIIEIGVFEG